MSEIQIVLVRHGPKRQDTQDENASLTVYGQQASENLATQLVSSALFLSIASRVCAAHMPERQPRSYVEV
jgi:phosphohistidine phosphatase SixA